MKISIVTTLYNSSKFIHEFHARTEACFKDIPLEREYIFVNDGSPDQSLACAVQLGKSNTNITVIDLAMNIGHHKAMMVGLKEASGDYVYLTDVDLEEPPETLSILWKDLQKFPEFDVHYAVRNQRQEPLLVRSASVGFYYVFTLLTGIKIEKGSMVSRIMSRQYVEGLLLYDERELFIPAIWEIVGFKQKSVIAEKVSLPHKSNYSPLKRVRMAINAIVSFSSMPLTAIFVGGTIVTFLSFLFVARIAIMKFYNGIEVPGWASIVASIYLVGGITIFSIGVIGFYISKIFIEVKRRPYSIIRKVYKQ